MRSTAAAVVAFTSLGTVRAQPPDTVGLMLNLPGAYVGYTLFSPLSYTDTYLIDVDGLLVHSWTTPYVPGNVAYLLENGDLLRPADPGGNPVFTAGGDAGLIQRWSWDGVLLWEYLYSDSLVRQHHDVEPMPNGNVLLIAWELKTAAEAIAAGRDPSTIADGVLWPDHIVEVEPVGVTGGNIVWEWHAWDHLIQDFDSTKANWGVVADHPELINLNYRRSDQADWLHFNAIDYHEELDQIVISPRRFDEFWILDHGTTTEEAAGHTGGLRGRGGDLLYRWGNPATYGAGTAADRKLWRQHDARWIEDGLPGAGNITYYNNGLDRPEGEYSTVEEVATTVDANGDYPLPPPGTPHGPAAQTWIYTADPPEDFFSPNISGAHRLPNGNTLICQGRGGRIFEVTPADTMVWEYISPVTDAGPLCQGAAPNGNQVFQARRHAPDFAGFDGRDLTPGDPIECEVVIGVEVLDAPTPFVLRASPNPFRGRTTVSFSLPVEGPVRLRVFDVRGRSVATIVDARLAAGPHVREWIPRRLPAGVYHVELSDGGRRESRKVVRIR
jgi:hypothetical protein